MDEKDHADGDVQPETPERPDCWCWDVQVTARCPRHGFLGFLGFLPLR
jgi:hypothetical protein